MSLDEALLGSDSIRQVRTSADGVFWLASIAAEDSRSTIRCWDGDGIIDITPEANVRSRVMEYGGGAYDVADSLVAWCDDRTRRVWLRDGQHRRPITPSSSRFRYGGLALVPERRWLLAVREDHDITPEERTEIVALDLDGDNLDGGQVLVTGADFYAGPTAMAGSLAWFQWQHPHMSWDEAAVCTAPLDHPEQVHVVAQGADVSAQHPLWVAAESLAYVSDESGYWNWHFHTPTAQHQWLTPHDCSTPTWVLDRAAACALNEDLIATVQLIDGRGTLALWQPSSGEISYPLPNTAMIESIAARGEDLFVIAEWDDRAASLVHISPTADHHEIVSSTPLPQASAPVSRWAEGKAGPVHSWFYPVANSTTPPLLVLTHGGPTSVHYPSFDKVVQFWTSRGIAVLDVNYSGSTGFGRKYRDRLKGQWGILDVADVVAAAQQLCDEGLADPARIAIAGGSAGGYTTLQALVSSDIFAAGMSFYGVADLRTLILDTHKAESRYTYSLVGPWPEAEQTYLERSPITQLDRLNAPMLILQGLQDRVVPPAQAYAMAEAVRAKGLPLALLTFPDEGHGFRGLDSRRRALAAQLSFLEQVFQLPLSPDVPVLAVEG